MILSFFAVTSTNMSGNLITFCVGVSPNFATTPLASITATDKK